MAECKDLMTNISTHALATDISECRCCHYMRGCGVQMATAQLKLADQKMPECEPYTILCRLWRQRYEDTP